MTHRERFAAALGMLADVYGKEVTLAFASGYWGVLEEYPIEAVEGGARAILRTEKWMPKPVEWAEAAEDWLVERRRIAHAHRLAIAQSNAPPLSREDVHRLVAELNEKHLGRASTR